MISQLNCTNVRFQAGKKPRGSKAIRDGETIKLLKSTFKEQKGLTYPHKLFLVTDTITRGYVHPKDKTTDHAQSSPFHITIMFYNTVRWILTLKDFASASDRCRKFNEAL